MKLVCAVGLMAVLSIGVPHHGFAQGAADPFQWLAEIRGDRSMAWVNAHNTSTLAELSTAPVYDSIYRRTLAILNSKARVAYPGRRGNLVYNFWTRSE